MARSSHPLLQSCSGHIGKTIVVKQYTNKIVLSKYPDMSKVKRSTLQKANNSLFAEAVAYAKGICNNPAQRNTYQSKTAKGQSVYHFALQEFYRLQERK